MGFNSGFKGLTTETHFAVISSQTVAVFFFCYRFSLLFFIFTSISLLPLYKYLFKLNLTFRGPCILIYSYNKTQQDALFPKFIFDKELYMFRADLLSIIRSLNIVYAAIGICHASYVGCMLARSG